MVFSIRVLPGMPIRHMSVYNATELFTYRVHGTTLQTPLALPCAPSYGAPEWKHVGPGDFPPAPETAECLASLRLGNIGYLARGLEENTWLEFVGQAEFLLNAQARQIYHRCCNGGDHRLVEQFVPNAVMALGLGLLGTPLLHASAVHLNNTALGIVGPSGAGKSSLAAALCASGASLVTDDTLRIATSASGCVAFAGSTRLRLRKSSNGLAHLLRRPIHPTGDGRLGVMFPSAANECPLRCLWSPRLIDASGQLRAVPVRGQARLLGLLSNVRIGGWSPSVMARLMPQLRAIASRLRFYQVQVPTGLVFSDSGRRELRELADTCVAYEGVQ